jgi:hypothetical protein
VLPAEITSEDDHRSARRKLAAAGWPELAHGDWAWVHGSPDGEQVARVCAFDPAYRLHVEACLAHPDETHFQRIDAFAELAPVGDLVVMERLFPADEARAQTLCDAIERETSPELRPLMEILTETAARGARTLGWFGGLDVRPGNTMQDATGQLKLIDPYFVAGPKLLAAMKEDIEAVAKHYTRTQLSALLEIAAFEVNEYPDAGADDLRAVVAGLEATA